MSKITKKQFLADVMHEIEMLKKHATPEEIARLNFGEFDPNEIGKCIYGQVAVECDNERAIELIKSCCLKSIDFFPSALNRKIDKMTISDILPNIQEPDKATTLDGRNTRSLDYISLLEGYIYTKGAKNGQIIAYLKGEQPTLTL